MKNYVHLLSMGMALMMSTTSNAQEALKTKITTKAHDSVINYTITSAKEFYMGGNKHILRVGSKQFDLYKQENEGGRGKLTFFIPKADFVALPEGENVYLTYGDIEGNGYKSLDQLCRENGSPCWSLGKLNKKITTIK